MDSDYRMFEIDMDLSLAGFQDAITFIKSQGFVIPGMVNDYATGKVIVIARKPTAEELDGRLPLPDADWWNPDDPLDARPDGGDER